MKTMKLTPLIVGIFFIACTGNLHPVSQNSFEAINYGKTENCSVSFNWLGKEGNALVFDIRIKNTSTETVYVDPDRFSYSASTRYPALYMVTPIDPQPLTEFDVSRGFRAKIRAKDTFKFLIGAVTAGLQAYNGFIFREGMLSNSIASDLATTTVSFAGEIGISALDKEQERLKEDLKYVPEEILKKTKIFPGESVQAKVFFEHIPNMKYYEFHIPVEGDMLTFSFAHKKSRN